jgi:hypothetical protein
MAWVERVVPWFAVTVLGLVAVWLAFPLYWAVKRLVDADEKTGQLWGTVALYGAAIVGVLFIALVAVRTVSPAQKWPRDGQVRAFATIGLILTAFTIPLVVLRGELIPVVALIIYYVRIRKALVDILPPWAGGTYRPGKQQQRRGGQEVIKRPPSSWNETSGVGPSRGAGGGQASGRSRRKQSKKKRKTGR